MHFTIEDYRKIEQWLKRNSVKDTEFPTVTSMSVNGQLPLIHEGKNKKINIQDFISFLNTHIGNYDSELNISSTNPIQNQAVARAIVDLRNRKPIKIVQELPPVESADDNIVYILPNNLGQENNIYTEWIKINNTYEKIGEFKPDIDLTPYLKIEDSPLIKGLATNSIQSATSTAEGNYSLALGYQNEAKKQGSLALGWMTHANGAMSHTEGRCTEAYNDSEYACGAFNKSTHSSIKSEATLFSIGNGSGTSSKYRKNALEVKQNGDLYIEGVDGRVQDKLNSSIIELLYKDLVSLRNSNKLSPGTFYKITDYITTTKKVNTKSKEHQFDIIVLALTKSTLLERAWACHHEGDTYFSKSNLSAWQIWYCLDNNINRFEWADSSEGGKGVIYRMIDEFNNDCPYDFKNIQFKTYFENSTIEWYYTFSYGDTDISVSGIAFNNIIENCKNKLPQNVFFSEDCHDNKLDKNCNNINISGSIVLNNFGMNCSDIIIKGHCYYNNFGSDCNNIESVGGSFIGNIISPECTHIQFKGMCYYNYFGVGCDYITLNANCNQNTFGASCSNIVIFSNSRANTFGTSCSYITLGTEDLGYFRFNKFAEGTHHVTLLGPTTAASNQQVQCYNIALGLSGTKNNIRVLEAGRNQYYDTVWAKDSKGKNKSFCIADLIS